MEGRPRARLLLQKGAVLLLALSLAAWLVWAALQGQPWHRSLLQPLPEEVTEFVYDPGLKYVLIWRNFFDEVNLGFPQSLGRGADLFRHCPQNACYMTLQRDLMAADNYDAVVVHAHSFVLASLPDGDKLPLLRRPEQVYIFFLLESPVNSGTDFRYMEDLFNWTMTYRLDSDIVLPYGEVRELEGNARVETWLRPPRAPPSPAEADAIMKNATAKKTKRGGARVAWLVSHCSTQSRREELVAQLQKHVAVDVFGDCGQRWPKGVPARRRFYQALADNYHFYLAFENSLCRDYVTEKLYNVMPHHVVPIVYGGANYSAVVPPASYIDVRDFPSPEHLGRYLQFLVSHPEEYEKFFWWKEHYRVVRYPPSVLCTLCSMLHSQPPPKSYPDMGQWWDKAANCQKPNLTVNSSWLN